MIKYEKNDGGFNMTQKIQILDTRIKNSELLLEIPSNVPISEFSAVGHMLVDSQKFSFIYLVEKNNEYTYIGLPEAIWPELNKAIENQCTFVLTNTRDRLELVGFHEEARFLIENIKGNSNYGEEMVAKVESIF